jgi:lysophospholipase L1-like esterase
MFNGKAILAASLLVNCAAVTAFSKDFVVVAFGDSTTATRGDLIVYAMRLEQAFAAKGVPVKVVNTGIGGNNTADARARFEKDVLAHKPNLAIIQFGLNDAAVNVWENPPATKPRVSLEDYEKNLRHFVAKLKAAGAEVILMTPNPCRWTDQLKKLYGKPPHKPDDPDGYNVLGCRYAEAVRKIARGEKVALIDVYKVFQDYEKQPGRSMNDLLLDGMHPNDKGHEIIAKMLLESKLIAEFLSNTNH